MLIPGYLCATSSGRTAFPWSTSVFLYVYLIEQYIRRGHEIHNPIGDRMDNGQADRIVEE